MSKDLFHALGPVVVRTHLDGWRDRRIGFEFTAQGDYLNGPMPTPALVRSLGVRLKGRKDHPKKDAPFPTDHVHVRIEGTLNGKPFRIQHVFPNATAAYRWQVKWGRDVGKDVVPTSVQRTTGNWREMAALLETR